MQGCTGVTAPRGPMRRAGLVPKESPTVLGAQVTKGQWEESTKKYSKPE